MFVAVLFGGRMELFNVNCRTVAFVHNLKERCGVDLQDSVDLMDKTGKLMNLNEKGQSSEPIGSILMERQTYILIRVSCGDGHGDLKYEPLLKDMNKSYPELAEVLRKLSNPSKEQDRRSGPPKKGSVSLSKSKPGVGSKKSQEH
ncbi:uncharacterized protein C22orf15 isoform X2 [Denticeps clupeoides]|uniref:uncharacterized protein C22orf15 isoform X2 n=1 Tax=Denticeps clupeoides TaxID=299321 RepID=UPI0010A3D417|nr:uncharacterized protein C22orf15 homolog isoform X2 [Denticeps clupeoides]